MPERNVRLEQYLADLNDRVAGLPAPDRARALAAELETLPSVMTELSRRRRDALAEARTTNTAQQIADELGVSRARVYKLLTEEV